MTAPRPTPTPRRGLGAASALLAAVLLLAACGPGRTPAPAMPPAPAAQRVEPAPPAVPATPAPPPAAPEAPAVEEATGGEADPEAGDGLTVVIDPGDPGEDLGRDLVAAARSERERRRDAGSPTAVITDESLPTYATGELTIATPASPPPTPEDPAALEARLAREGERETYWRQRVLEVRTRWREAVDRIAELEGRAAELRRRFYSEDDPYYRDSQIKPAWDRALESLEENREAIDRAKAELERTLEEGRVAGALPGWLREGVELEPEQEEAIPEDPGDPTIYEPMEPQIVDEDGPGAGGAP